MGLRAATSGGTEHPSVSRRSHYFIRTLTVCDRSELQQYVRAIIVTLLTRMQTSKTDNYVYHFVYFLLFSIAINVEGLTPDFILGAVEEVQPKSV